MDLTPRQLSSLSEMGIPVWALRSGSGAVSEDLAPNEQILDVDCFVLIEPDSHNDQRHRLLQAILFSIGLTPDQFVMINSEQLAQLQNTSTEQKVLLVFGESLAQSLWGKSVARGQVVHQIVNVPIIVSFSLNELLLSPDNKALVWQDLLLAKQFLNAD